MVLKILQTQSNTQIKIQISFKNFDINTGLPIKKVKHYLTILKDNAQKHTIFAELFTNWCDVTCYKIYLDGTGSKFQCRLHDIKDIKLYKDNKFTLYKHFLEEEYTFLYNYWKTKETEKMQT